MNSLKNKHFLITGASSGIGKGIVKQLLGLQANVSFCGRSPDKLDKFVSELSPSEKDQIFYQAFDITNFNEISNYVSAAIEHFGYIDFLVNNAGVNSARALVNEIELNDLQWMLNVNMIAPFLFMKETYNQSMLHNKNGVIINIMSTVCLFSNPNIGAYTASKTGFDGLSKVFRKEARDNGIKVCSIYPGGVDTPFRAQQKPEYLEVKDIVEAVIFLAEQPSNSCVDELIIRPMIERNFT